MMIHLNLNKVDEAKMRELMKKDRRPFTQAIGKKMVTGPIKSFLLLIIFLIT